MAQDEKYRQWYEFGIFKTAELCRQEPDRARLMEEYRRWETRCVDVMSGLGEQEREAVENYIACVINLEYQKARVAYELGKQVGSGAVVPPKVADE